MSINIGSNNRPMPQLTNAAARSAEGEVAPKEAAVGNAMKTMGQEGAHALKDYDANSIVHGRLPTMRSEPAMGQLTQGPILGPSGPRGGAHGGMLKPGEIANPNYSDGTRMGTRHQSPMSNIQSMMGPGPLLSSTGPMPSGGILPKHGPRLADLGGIINHGPVRDPGQGISGPKFGDLGLINHGPVQDSSRTLSGFNSVPLEPMMARGGMHGIPKPPQEATDAINARLAAANEAKSPIE